MRQRILAALILLPIGLVMIYLGGWAYASTMTLVLGLAAWEYWRIFQTGDYQPQAVLVIGGVLLLALARAWTGFEHADWLLSILILCSMAYHLIAYERGRDQSAVDFAVTLSGIFYIGWLGSYLISLRALPNGLWWVLTILPIVWITDSGAYFIGRAIGRRKFSPRLSPKKTWEGFIGGVISGTVGGVLLVLLWGLGEPGLASPLQGGLLGLALALLTVFGDLGASMIKRQFGVKDSSHLIPGHGGVFDRIDSWIWAGVIGYYLVSWFVL